MDFLQTLLGNGYLKTFTEAHEKARSIELAKLNCKTYTCQDTSSRQMCALQKDETKSNENNVSVIASKNNLETLRVIFVESLNGIPAVAVLLKTKFVIFAKR